MCPNVYRTSTVWPACLLFNYIRKRVTKWANAINPRIKLYENVLSQHEWRYGKYFFGSHHIIWFQFWTYTFFVAYLYFDVDWGQNQSVQNSQICFLWRRTHIFLSTQNDQKREKKKLLKLIICFLKSKEILNICTDIYFSI